MYAGISVGSQLTCDDAWICEPRCILKKLWLAEEEEGEKHFYWEPATYPEVCSRLDSPHAFVFLKR